VQIIGDNEWLENIKKLLCHSELDSESLKSNKSLYNKIVLDTETTSLDIIKAELIWISILLDEKNIYYINVWHNWPKADKSKLRDFLNYLLNSDITIIGHNIKYDLEIIELFLKKTENWPVSGVVEQKFEKKETISNNNFWQMTLEL
jgi:DNA polymerase I-like protein with 3'-5' exonuclease and polymerase domains